MKKKLVSIICHVVAVPVVLAMILYDVIVMAREKGKNDDSQYHC